MADRVQLFQSLLSDLLVRQMRSSNVGNPVKLSQSFSPSAMGITRHEWESIGTGFVTRSDDDFTFYTRSNQAVRTVSFEIHDDSGNPLFQVGVREKYRGAAYQSLRLRLYREGKAALPPHMRHLLEPSELDSFANNGGD